MGIRSWSITPVNPTFSQPFLNEHYEEKIAELNKLNEAIPFRGEDRLDYESFSKQLAFDRDTGEMFRGPLDIEDALRQSTDMYFHKGYMGVHAGGEQMQASLMMMTEEDREALSKAPMLKYSDEAEGFLESFARGTKWNFLKTSYTTMDGGTGWRSPIDPFNSWGAEGDAGWSATPQDLFKIKPPEGWTPEEALEEMEEFAPEYLEKYATYLGGIEEVKEIVKDSRVPYEFFYRLNAELQNRSIANSLAHQFKKNSDKGMGWKNIYEQWGKEFIVSSIINDPDMAAGMALTALLTATTVVGGAASGVLLGAAKITKLTKTIDRMISLSGIASKGQGIARGAKSVSALTQKIPRLALYLPENLGPTLIRRHLGSKWLTQSLAKKAGWYTLGNAVEGALTGSLAEIQNQDFQIDKNTMQEHDWFEVYRQGAFEAMISPVINPIMGFVMHGGPRMALRTMSYLNKRLTPEVRGGMFSDAIAAIYKNLSPTQVAERIEIHLAHTDASTDVAHMLGDSRESAAEWNESHPLIHAVTALMNQEGQHNETLMTVLALHIKQIREAHDTTKSAPKTVPQVGALLINSIMESTQGDTKDSTNDTVWKRVLGELLMRTNLSTEHKAWNEKAKTNKSFDEFMAWKREEDPQGFLTIIPPVIQELGKLHFEASHEEGTWDSQSPENKIGWSVEASQRTADSQNPTLTEENNLTNQVKTAEETVEEAIDSGLIPTTPKSEEPTEGPKSLEEAAARVKARLGASNNQATKALIEVDKAKRELEAFLNNEFLSKDTQEEVPALKALEEAQAISDELDLLNKIADEDMTEAQHERAFELWNILVVTDGDIMATILKGNFGRTSWINANLGSHEGRLRIVQFHWSLEGEIRKEVSWKLREEHGKNNRGVEGTTEAEIWANMEEVNRKELEENPDDPHLFVKGDVKDRLRKNLQAREERAVLDAAIKGETAELDYSDAVVGDTIEVIGIDGVKRNATVTAISEKGTIAFILEGGKKEHFLGSKFAQEVDPSHPEYTLQALGYDQVDVPVKSLTDAELDMALVLREKNPASKLPEMGAGEQHISDITALKAEQARRKTKVDTESAQTTGEQLNEVDSLTESEENWDILLEKAEKNGWIPDTGMAQRLKHSNFNSFKSWMKQKIHRETPVDPTPADVKAKLETLTQKQKKLSTFLRRVAVQQKLINRALKQFKDVRHGSNPKLREAEETIDKLKESLEVLISDFEEAYPVLHQVRNLYRNSMKVLRGNMFFAGTEVGTVIKDVQVTELADGDRAVLRKFLDLLPDKKRNLHIGPLRFTESQDINQAVLIIQNFLEGTTTLTEKNFSTVEKKIGLWLTREFDKLDKIVTKKDLLVKERELNEALAIHKDEMDILFHDRISQDGALMLSAKITQETLAWQDSALTSIKARQDGWAIVVQGLDEKGTKTISKQRLLHFLPLTSRFRINTMESIEAGNESITEPLQLSYAKEVFNSEASRYISSINKIEKSAFRDFITPITPGHFSEIFSHEAGRDVMLTKAYTEEYRIQKGTPGTALDGKAIDMGEFYSLLSLWHDTLEFWHSGRSTQHVKRNGRVVITGKELLFNADTQLREGKGLGLVTMFEEHLVEPVDASTTAKNMNWRSENIEFYYDGVIADLRDRNAAATTLGDPEQHIISENLAHEAYIKLLDDNNPEGYNSHNVALGVINDAIAATSFVNKEAWSEWGFVLTIDPLTQLPANKKNSIDFDAYKKEVVKTIVKRLQFYSRDGRNPDSLNPIYKAWQLENLKPDEQSTLTENKLQQLATEMAEDISIAFKEDVTLEQFGNGDKGWIAADKLGLQLVDYFLKPDMYTKNPLFSAGVIHPENRGSESVVGEGDKTAVQPPLEGDINHVSTLPVWLLDSIFKNDLGRQRFAWVLNRDNITASVLAEWARIREEGYRFPTETTIHIEDTFWASLVPYALGDVLQKAPMSREDQIKRLVTIALDTPQKAHTVVHDKVIASGDDSFLRISTEEGFPLATDQLVSAGDDYAVPFHRIGFIRAQAMGSFLLTNMTEGSLRLTEKLIQEYNKKYNVDLSSEEGITDALRRFHSIESGRDMLMSARYLTHMQSRMGDPTLIKRYHDVENAISKLFFNEDLGEFVYDKNILQPKTKEWYRAGTLYIFNLIAGQSDTQQKRLSTKVESFMKILQPLRDNDITTLEKWDAYELANPDDKVVSLVRYFMKFPLMRNLYGMTATGWREVFRTSEGIEILNRVTEDSGQKLTEDDIENIGDIIFNGALTGSQDLIWRALGLDFPGDPRKSPRAAALEWLSLDRDADTFLPAVKHLLASNDAALKSRKDTKTGEEKNLLYSLEHHTKLLNEAVRTQAAIEYHTNEPTDAQVATMFKKYEQSAGRQKKFLEREDIPEDFGPQYEKLWAEYESLAYDKLVPWEHIGAFKAWNTLNDSGYSIALSSIEQMARIFHLEKYDAKKLLGLDNYIFYHMMLPTSKVVRGMDTNAGSGFSPIGIGVEKVITNFETFKQWITAQWDSRTETVMTEAIYDDLVTQYIALDPDHIEILGVQKLEDSGLMKMYKKGGFETVLEEIEMLMVQNEMLFASTYGAIPVKGYTLEDNVATIYKATADSWMKHTEKYGPTREKERAYQETLEKDPAAKTKLKVIKQTGNNLLPSQGPVRQYGIREHSSREAFPKNSKPLSFLSQQERGLKAFDPLYETVPYTSLPNLFMLGHYHENKMNEMAGPLDIILGNESKEGQVIKEEDLGYPMPWAEADMPKPAKLWRNDINSILGRKDISPQTSELFHELNNFAEKKGLIYMDSLTKREDAFVNLYLMMKFEEAKETIISARGRYNRTAMSKDEVVALRSQWITGIHTISAVSRDIKTVERTPVTLVDPGMPLALANVPSDTVALIDQLQSYYASEDKPTGLLLQPTLMRTPFELGLTPVEMIIRDKDGNPTDELIWTDTEAHPLSEQSADAPILLFEITYPTYIAPVLQTYKDGKFKHIAKDYGMWMTQIPIEDRIAIENLAYLSATGVDGKGHGQSIVFDTSFVREVHRDSTVRQELLMTDIAEITIDGVTVDYRLRNLLDRAGFGMFMQTPQTLQGKTIQLSLTAAGALKMMMMAENHMPLRTMRESMNMNIPLGSTTDSSGVITMSQPSSSFLKNTQGTNVFSQMEELVKLTGALETIGETVGSKKIRTVTEGKRGRKINNVIGKYVDLDYYAFTALPGEYGKAKESFASPWKESHISVLSELATRLDKSGRGRHQQEVVKALRETATGARTNSVSLATAIAFSVLYSQGEQTGNWNPDLDMLRVFMDERMFTEKEVISAAQTAETLLMKVSSIRADENLIFNNPYSWEAQAYIQSLTPAELKTLSESTDKKTMDTIAYDFLVKQGKTPDSSEAVFEELANSHYGFDGQDGNVLAERLDYRAWLEDREKVFVVDIETTLEHDNISIITTYDKATADEQFYSGKKVGEYLTKEQVTDVLNTIEERQAEGYKIVTHNGNSFDFRVLGNLSENTDAAFRSSHRTLDTMDNLRSMKGVITEFKPDGSTVSREGQNFYIKLSNLAKALGIKQVKSLDFGGFEATLLFERVRGNTVTLTKQAKELGMTTEHIEKLNKLTKITAWNKLKKYAKGDVTLNYKVLYGDGDVKGLVDIKGPLTIEYAPDKKTNNRREVTIDVDEVIPTWLLSQRKGGGFEGTLSLYNEWSNLDKITTSTRGLHSISERMKNFEGESELVKNGGEELGANLQQVKNALTIALGEQIVGQNYEPTTWLSQEELQFGYNDVKSHSKFISWAEQHTDDPHLANLGDKLHSLEKDGIFTKRAAMTARSVLLKLYQMNPWNVKEMTLNAFDALAREGATGFANIEGITLGKEALKTMGKRKGHKSVMMLFVHELSHMSGLRFATEENGDWLKWTAMHKSTFGKSTLRKLVTAWHGGIETKTVLDEIDRFDANPEEFLAAQVSFMVLNDLTDIQLDFEKAEYEVMKAAMPLISRIMKTISNTFLRIGSVFRSLNEGENKENMAELVSLIERTLGYDRTLKDARLSRVKKPRHDEDLYWMERIDTEITNPKSYEHSMIDIKNMVLEFELLGKRAETGLSTEESSRFVEIENTLKAIEDVKEDLSFFGNTRVELATAEDTLLSRYSRHDNYDNTKKEPVILDVEYLMKKGAAKDRSLGMDLVITDLQEIYGSQILRHMGENASSFFRKFDSILPGVNPDTVRSWMVNLMAGNTGAQYTWNSISIIPVLLTVLLDDDAVTTFADYTKGDTPSIRRVLDGFRKWNDMLVGERDGIYNILNSTAKTVLIGGHPQGANVALMGHINEAVLRHADKERSNSGYNIEQDIHPDVRNHPQWNELKVHIIGGTIKKERVTGMAAAYRGQIEAIEEKGIEIQEFGREFTSLAPWFFGQGLKDDAKTTSFWNQMLEIIDNRIRKEGTKASGSIDPGYFLQAGLLPRLDPTFLTKDLEALRKTNSPMLKLIAMRVVESLEGESITDTAENILFARLQSEDVTIQPQWQEATRKVISSLLKKMGRRDYTFRHLTEDLSKTQRSNYRKAYLESIRSSYLSVVGTDKNSFLLESFMNDADPLIPLSIWSKRAFTGSNTNKQGRLTSSAHMHINNLIIRGTKGVYFANDAWAIPSVLEAIENNPAVRNVVTFDTPAISGALLRGVGDRIFELNFLHEKLGIYGDYSSLIRLFKSVVNDDINGHIANSDGVKINEAGLKQLVKSTEILEDKWRAYRHIKQTPDHQSSLESWLFKVAPNMVKIVFGPSLVLASVTTENMLASFSELIGKGNIRGFFTQALSPIFAASPTERKRIGRDLASTVGGIESIFLGDTETPSSMDTPGFFDKWASVNMRVAQYVHSSIARGRAKSMRIHLSDMIRNGKLENFVESLYLRDSEGVLTTERKPEVLTNPDHILELAHKAGISSSFDNIVIQFNKTGVLELGAFRVFKAMIQEGTDGYQTYYSPNEMLQDLFAKKPTGNEATDVMDTNGYRLREDIIQSLRDIELTYIQETMTHSKPMDVTTRGGGMDYILELFRKYPVLFFLQHVMRKASRHTPIRWAAGALGLMFLDMLYMMLLRISAGDRVEDLIEESSEDPVSFWFKYGSRLPVFGRYGGFAMEALNLALVSSGGRSGGTPGAFIPAAAVMTEIGAIKRALTGLAEGNPTIQDFTNAARVVPYVSPPIRMMVIHGLAGNELDKKRKKVGVTDPGYSSWGMSTTDADLSDLRIASEFMKYFNSTGQAKSLALEATQQQGKFFAPPAADAPAPVAAPEPTRIPEVEPSMVSRMEEPGGKELADWGEQQQ